MASDSIVELTVGDVVKATVKNIFKDYAIVTFGKTLWLTCHHLSILGEEIITLRIN